MIRALKLFPDRVLSIACPPVPEITPDILRLIQDLRDTLEASPGVGLAAPQIGVSRRVALVDVTRDRRKTPRPGSRQGLLILVNPAIVGSEGLQVPREGCLSVPDLLADVRRFERVRVRAKDESGRERLIEARGFEALALQHEVDHLDGKLFLDRVANVKTDLFRRKA